MADSRLSALGAALLLASTSPSAGDLVDGIAAQVGSDVVLISEVMRIAEPMETRLREAGATEPEIARLRADVLERLIERRLVTQLALRLEIEATDSEADAAAAAIAEENDLTLDELRGNVERQGLPFEAYRERLREEIVHQKVLSGMVGARVRVEERAVRRLYEERFATQRQSGEEVHLRHLLVTAPDGSPPAPETTCARAREALARVQAGEPFEAVAREVSEANPERGGDLGWIHARELAAWMGPVVVSLEPGEVSEVVETPFGCNVLKLLERRQARPVSYEEAKSELRNELFEGRFEDEYRVFMERLRAQTYIERKGVFAEAARLGTPPVPAPSQDLPFP